MNQTAAYNKLLEGDLMHAVTDPLVNGTYGWVWVILMTAIVLVIYLRTQEKTVPLILTLVFMTVGVSYNLIPLDSKPILYGLVVLTAAGVFYSLTKGDGG